MRMIAAALLLVSTALTSGAQQAAPVTPTVVEFELGNGLRVLLVPAPSEERVTMRLSVLAGSAFEPADRVGLSRLLAGSLLEGTVLRDANEFRAALRREGGSITARADDDFLIVEAGFPADGFVSGVAMLSEVVLRPELSPDAVEKARTDARSGLSGSVRGTAGIQVTRNFLRAVYGEHPYGRLATEASLRGISRADVVAFHQQRVLPAQGVLTIVGPVDSVSAHFVIEQAFGAWSGRGAPMPAARPAPQRARPEIVIVHQPDATRSSIAIGNVTWMPTDGRNYAFALALEVLQRRLEPGWSASAEQRRGLGYFVVTGSAPTVSTDTVIEDVLARMRRMSTQLTSRDELQQRRSTVLALAQRPEDYVLRVERARLLGLATDYPQRFPQRMNEVLAEQVQAVARAGMRADAALIVVRGDATQLQGPLARIAPVRVVDDLGEPLSLASGPAATPTIVVDRLAAHVDSFTVLLQGQKFGFQRAELRRSADGWAFEEESALGPIIQQRTAVQFSADLAMRSTQQTGKFQGNDLRVSVEYRDGLAFGEGMTPGGGSMRAVRYDSVAVPTGAVDDNLLLGVLPFVEWSAGAQLSLPVFSSGRGVLETRRLRVVGEEVVTVPAGTFAAWRIAYEGGEAPGTYWVEIAAPHRVLKFGPASIPIEFVRER